MNEEKKRIKVIVYHTDYGCESGCCGHQVEVGDDKFSFEFIHPYKEDFQKWAREFAQNAITEKYGEDHVADLDWENCRISED